MTKDERLIFERLAEGKRLMDYSSERARCYEMVWPNGAHRPVKAALVTAMVRKGLLVRSGWQMLATQLAAETFEIKTAAGKVVRPGLPAAIVAAHA
jgi:hypothetical protein